MSNYTPNIYCPVPTSRPGPIQTEASPLESVERALGALSLSTDNPIKDLSSVNKSFDAKNSFDAFDTNSSNIFSSDFIAAVAASLDDFDPGIFRPDEDINFERDFGAWFNDDLLDTKSKTTENGAKGKGKEIREEDEFSLCDTEFLSPTPLFASPSLSVSDQHHLPALNSRNIPPPLGPTLRRRDRVSKNAVNSEPSVNAVTPNISSECLIENFERDFGEWFNQDTINSALDHEFEASDFDVFDWPAGR